MPISFRLLFVCIIFIFSSARAQAGNSFYVTVTNDTVWGTGIWPQAGFDEQLRMLFVDVDSNMHELSPDTVATVVINKQGYREVFKVCKTQLWGKLFLHQTVNGIVSFYWGYDFDAHSKAPMSTWDQGHNNGGQLISVSFGHAYISRTLMTDPYPQYSEPSEVLRGIFYLQREDGVLKRIYDMNFKKQMARYFADAPQLAAKIKEGKYKFRDLVLIVKEYNLYMASINR